MLFTNGHGTPWRRSRWGELWRPIIKDAKQLGIPAGTGFHDLRHYYASLLIRQGSSVKTVQERLGHASAMVTLDTYGHLWPDSEDQTRDAIDAELVPAIEGTADQGMGIAEGGHDGGMGLT